MDSRPGSARYALAIFAVGTLVLVVRSHAPDAGIRGAARHSIQAQTSETRTPDMVAADQLIRRQPRFFVANLGQWAPSAKFVHRSGPMTLFLCERGWVLDLARSPAARSPAARSPTAPTGPDGDKAAQRSRGVVLRMTFAGSAHRPEITGEQELDGHHNYFLGSDRSRWRAGVPRYAAVRYESLYPGIDLRLREMHGVPEYDLLLRPGADLAQVTVLVEGGEALSIAGDGSLVIETSLGPLIQPKPKTWQVDSDGNRREVACEFALLGVGRFGFVAPGWDRNTSLTIDPGLIWSTFLGGSSFDTANAHAVDDRGVVTVVGVTGSIDFPTTTGAYDTSYNDGSGDAFISRLDPGKNGSSQLLFSTFLGGRTRLESANAVAVDPSGVVTVAGLTASLDFPTTSGAFDTTYNGTPNGKSAFVSRLDPSKAGTAQLLYSTFLGGTNVQGESVTALSVDAAGVVTVVGQTHSADFPTTSGAYRTTLNANSDVFVSRLDPSKSASAQLVYSTLLGGGVQSSWDQAAAVSVDAQGVITVAGTTSASDYPITTGAYDTTFNGGGQYPYDVVLSRLDPRNAGAAQLVYSTFLGGSAAQDWATAMRVDGAVVTVVGWTLSKDFPTTSGAYDTTFNGSSNLVGADAFISRLDLSKTGSAQLIYSTFFGGTDLEQAFAVGVDDHGMVTVAGRTESANFPTTSGAFDTTFNGGAYDADAFVSRLDPSRSGAAQLVYSTFLGASGYETATALVVDASGVVTVVGDTKSGNFPTSSGAYDRTHNGPTKPDAFCSRLDMGVALYGDVHEIPIQTGGTQILTVDAGTAHANLLYQVFGSVTGSRPGLTLLGVHVPLNPDWYTDVAMAAVNSTVFTRFKGRLDSNGRAAASFIVPAGLPAPSGFTFHHAYLVYDATGRIYMASNAVPLRLR